MYCYRISGLAVGSDIALPGMVGLPAALDPADVAIRFGSVPAALENARCSGPTWQIAGNQFLLRIPDIARFLLRNGREIVFEPETDGDARDIPIFLLGTAFGILLHQRAQIVLHGSAVRVNGKAILFCGPSGAGKSTLAAALAQRGYPLVTDDVCSVSMDGAGRPTVQSDGRQLKLWAHTIGALGLDRRRRERVRPRLEKFYVDAVEVSHEPLPLGAIYALRETRPPHASGIERPNVVDAALVLRRNAYRPLIVRRMEQAASYFHAAVATANTAGIFHLTRELNFAKLPDVMEMLERHWWEAGLMEQVG